MGKEAKPRQKVQAKASPKAKPLSPFNHHGGKESVKLAKDIFARKKAAMTAMGASSKKGWPQDVVADDRWCSWMPDGWTPALKMTAGKILIQGMVGPLPEDGELRKFFFHKADLEKYLGRKLDLDERGKKPKDYGNINPKEFLHRTDREPACSYIKTRCDSLHGYSVEEALGDFKYMHGEGDAKQKQYSMQDLKYDVEERKFLQLVPERPAAGARQAAPSTPAPNASSDACAAPSTPKRQDSGASASGRLVQMPSTPAKRPRVAPAAAASASGKQARLKSAEDYAQMARREIFEQCYEPFKTRAALSVEDEKSMCALVGAGFDLGIDAMVLKSLKLALRIAPEGRGKIGQAVLEEFEGAYLQGVGV